MLGIKLEDSTASYDHTSKTFAGVRFVLLGFDPISDQKIRSRLVNGGGVDVGHYGPVCTHVIVHKLVYDDPICVAARMDGKVLVTGLWVDHSFDVGMLVDPASVMYRPLKGNDGIPGAKSLIVCLTGYQRQDRDDIMTMVGLMGANFSKPLVANKVTHLICYKFEGEKYELAKKIKRIKLVNHRWLEDCLKAWTILPETDYNKSGYELEMMEAEAKDSEEEDVALDAGTKQSEEMKNVTSPDTLMARARGSPQSKENLSKILPTLSASKGLPHTSARGNTLLASGEESLSAKMLNIQDTNKKGINGVGFLDPVGATCDEPQYRTPTSAKEASLVAHSDAAMSSSISYSRKAISRSTIPLSEGENSNNLVSCSRVDVDSVNTNGGFEAYLSREEQHKVGNDTGLVRSPAKEESNSLSGKGKMDVSSGNSKLPKTNPDSKASGSPLLSNVTKTSVTAVLVNASVDKNASPTSRYTSPVNKANASPQSGYTSLDNMAKGNISSNEQMSSSKCISKLEEPRHSSVELENMGLPIDHGIDDIGTTTELQRKQEDAQVPSPKAKSLGIENLSGGPQSQILKVKDFNLLEKPVRKKAIAKRTWNSGSKREVGLGKSKNQKGSIYLYDGAPASIVENNDCVNPKKSPPNVNFDKSIALEVNDVENPENEHMEKMGSVNDETEAPEDKEAGFFPDVSGEKAEETNEVNMAMKDKSECTISSTTNADDKAEGTPHVDVGGANFEKKDDGGENEADEPTASKGRELEKSTKSSLGKTKLVQLVSGKRKSMVGVSTEYENKTKKQKMGLNKGKSNLSQTAKTERTVPLDKADISNEVEKENITIGNKKAVRSVLGKRKSKEGIGRDETENKMNNQKIGLIKEYSSPATTAKIKRKPPLKKAESPIEVEKENRPVDIHDPNVGQQIAKAASNFKKMPAKIRSKDGVTDQGSVLGAFNKQNEPTWFILTGHKLQRKELQLVIKRLRGRVCRDSHQWSYQATHLIFPDPLRRTEKFFAAAASGRWILKTDYLATCNQEGKFLAEEPYEWYKKGLSEDGAINLEAPRKWRLLRERTGHGALYGMRVIIYGECIAPPLDTLKRVVKAGDGTILATSPPYSRFLNSGVDYAIVSPGMPRVDMWIQEFLRHEIPCVLADYLVEYVCKPGYPLEKHVQYSTQAWAERSFTNLQNHSEEIVLDKEVPEEDTEDVPCQVCGSTDRGEVMLICGDESGSLGCGVGTHIDCCSPPLESVPEEDWFCPKCSESKKSKGRSKSTK